MIEKLKYYLFYEEHCLIENNYIHYEIFLSTSWYFDIFFLTLKQSICYDFSFVAFFLVNWNPKCQQLTSQNEETFLTMKIFICMIIYFFFNKLLPNLFYFQAHLSVASVYYNSSNCNIWLQTLKCYALA